MILVTVAAKDVNMGQAGRAPKMELGDPLVLGGVQADRPCSFRVGRVLETLIGEAGSEEFSLSL